MQRTTRWIALSTIVLGGSLLCVSSASADITDTFSTDSANWQHVGDNTTPPTYNATGGNPGGYISITDPANGTADYFVAPAKYLGNQSGSIGKTLSFDIHLSNATDYQTDDVDLSNGGTTLAYLFSPQITTTNTWVPETLTLAPSDPNWHLGSSTGPAPSLSDFQSVLSSLTTFKILADYHSGTETVGLDNVVLQTPEPATLGLLAGPMLLLLSRRQRGK